MRYYYVVDVWAIAPDGTPSELASTLGPERHDLIPTWTREYADNLTTNINRIGIPRMVAATREVLAYTGYGTEV